MESLKLCISLLLLLVVRTDSQICPVLEGGGITLNCTVLFKSNSFDKQITWIKGVNGVTTIVATCDADNASCTLSPATLPYTVTLTNINALNATSNIAISSAARSDQGSWSCSGPLNQDVSACDLKVFSTPTSVSCSQPELHNDNVQVTCTGDRVYPQPLCQFTWIKDGTPQSTNNVAAKNQTLSQPQNTDYFYPECTWTIPVQTLGFGTHIFKVLMYPNVTGNTATDMTYGRNSNLTSPVEIYRPEVVLESCSQGYIKEGTTASCTCREKKNVFLKANVRWSGSPGASVVVGKQTSTLNFTANRNSPNYICGAEVLGVWSENKTFVPQVAYGPDQVVMKVQINGVDKTVLDLCGKPPTSQTMTVSCTVSDVRPSVTVRYFINGNVQTVGSASSVDYPVTSGGNLEVKCTANNTQFSEIYKANTTLLLVREPPNAPVLEPKPGNDQQVTVKEGLVRIWCRVDGGYPNVTQLTLNCNGSSTTSAGNTVSVEMNVTRKMNSGACFCTATHPSTCYANNNATSTLNVLYPPTITNFTVTGAVNQEVQDNTNVMFSCEAEGNPAPSLIQPRDSLSQIMRQIMSNNKPILEWNKIMSCQDSGIYVCKAESSEGEEEKTMEIYVLCKQQLGSMESQNKVYSIKANKTFDINITVIGYPEPQLSLHSSKTLHKNEYNLTYYTTTPGNGVINLQIHTVLEAYNQKYELNITNIQGSFIYSFEIRAENAEETDGPGSVGGSDVGAIVGGIVAGIVVIVLVAVIVYIARRKGLLNKCIKKESSPVFQPSADFEENVPSIPEYGASSSLNGSIMAGQAADPHYMNIGQPSSPYESIDPPDTADVPYMNDVPNKDTKLSSPYEEIRTAADNSSIIVTTNMREAQSYSNYKNLEDETPGTAGTRDYVNQEHQVSHAGTRDYVNQELEVSHAGTRGQEDQVSQAGTRDYVNQEHQVSHAGTRGQEHQLSHAGVVQYENFLPPL